jgi:HK97 family phage prohead protease
MNTDMRQLEVRTAALGPIGFRAAADGIGNLVGYAAKYGKFSQNLGGFVEVTAAGAFSKSLADRIRVMCRYNHDDAGLLGTTDAGTLVLTSDDEGLQYDVSLPDTSVGRDVRVLAQRRDLQYSSFAFYTVEDEWTTTDQGFPLRILKQVRLIDVAPVNDPAYRDTDVAVRSLQERVGLDLAEFMTLEPEERRTRISGITPPEPSVDPSTGEDNGEQRDTHSSLSILRAHLELEARR